MWDFLPSRDRLATVDLEPLSSVDTYGPRCPSLVHTRGFTPFLVPVFNDLPILAEPSLL